VKRIKPIGARSVEWVVETSAEEYPCGFATCAEALEFVVSLPETSDLRVLLFPLKLLPAASLAELFDGTIKVVRPYDGYQVVPGD
jgi:hypothetical protein